MISARIFAVFGEKEQNSAARARLTKLILVLTRPVAEPISGDIIAEAIIEEPYEEEEETGMVVVAAVSKLVFVCSLSLV